MQRIAKSFIDFYGENYEYLQKHNANLKKCKNEFFEILSTNGSIFTKLYSLNPRVFCKNFSELKKNIIENRALWEKQLGEKSFYLFISGVFYLQQIFY